MPIGRRLPARSREHRVGSLGGQLHFLAATTARLPTASICRSEYLMESPTSASKPFATTSWARVLVHSSRADLPAHTMSLLLKTWPETMSGQMFYARPGGLESTFRPRRVRLQERSPWDLIG
jgi:hypothetical protein